MQALLKLLWARIGRDYYGCLLYTSRPRLALLVLLLRKAVSNRKNMPASVDSSADQLFELGLFRFKLSSSDPEELHLLQQAFQPILQAPSVSYDQIINTDDCRGLIPPVHPIEAVIARAFRFHDGSLYVCLLYTSSEFCGIVRKGQKSI